MTQQEFFTRYTYNTRTDKLGGGAFGTVYKAYDNVLDKYVAIKISEVKTIGGKEFSLMDEFNAIKGLSDHTNIAKYEQLFSFDQPNGVFDFAIIQYYPDGNLKDLIKNEKLTQTEKEKIAKQILEGLSFLHHHKVVHRDMKPSNILIHKREGKNYIPKIADFGLSKKADPNAKSRFTNSFGGGTLEYSSPEQLRGQNLRFNTDLWAWAVIVYELFTEKPLFQPKNNNTASAENEKEIFEQILNKDISSSLKDIPTNWSNALLACLDRNPETRVKTAGEIQNILNEKIHPLQKPEPPKGNEEKEELNLKEDKTKIFENEHIKKEKKKSYKYLLWVLPAIITFVSVLLYFSLNNKPAEVDDRIVLTDSISKNVNDTILVDKTKQSTIEIKKNNSKKTEQKKVEPNKPNIDKPITEINSNWREKYDYVGEFQSGLAIIKKSNKFGFVDNKGIEVIRPEFDIVNNVREDRILVFKNKKCGFIDKNGKLITEIIYESGTAFNEGFGILSKDDKYFYIDDEGNRILYYYDKASIFAGGIAAVKKDGKFFFINKKGEFIREINETIDYSYFRSVKKPNKYKILYNNNEYLYVYINEFGNFTFSYK